MRRRRLGGHPSLLRDSTIHRTKQTLCNHLNTTMTGPSLHVRRKRAGTLERIEYVGHIQSSAPTHSHHSGTQDRPKPPYRGWSQTTVVR